MLFPKTLYSFHQPILCPYRHLCDAEGGFYLGVADNIVFSEFLHTERLEGEMSQPPSLAMPFISPFGRRQICAFFPIASQMTAISSLAGRDSSSLQYYRYLNRFSVVLS